MPDVCDSTGRLAKLILIRKKDCCTWGYFVWFCESLCMISWRANVAEQHSESTQARQRKSCHLPETHEGPSAMAESSTLHLERGSAYVHACPRLWKSSQCTFKTRMSILCAKLKLQFIKRMLKNWLQYVLCNFVKIVANSGYTGCKIAATNCKQWV